jgi:hypothetical protein
VTGGWRKLHNEELHGLYSSPSIVRVNKARRMRWAGHVVLMGEVRGAYNILVGRPKGRRPLGNSVMVQKNVCEVHGIHHHVISPSCYFLSLLLS